ncbi:hypothetical protein [Propionibacterium freudenreichii]|uniref:hypothetical protein n=1 Tax=Propionibacterium freudenreichii TaxID=1744 RepID=UPI003D2A7839
MADGRQQRLLHDIGVFGVPVLLVWSRRTWRCRQHSCPQVSWGEETQLAPPLPSTSRPEPSPGL